MGLNRAELPNFGTDSFINSFLIRTLQVPSEEGLVNVSNGFKLLGYGAILVISLPVLGTVSIITNICRLALSILTLSKENFKKSVKYLSLSVFTVATAPLLAPIFCIKILIVDLIFCNQFARFNERSLHNSRIKGLFGYREQEHVPAPPIQNHQLPEEEYIQENDQLEVEAIRQESLKQEAAIQPPEQNLIKQGAYFLITHVLKGANENTLKDFEDSFNLHYILTKAIYLYVAGSHKESEQIPFFFHEENISKINDLRKKITDENTRTNLATRIKKLEDDNITINLSEEEKELYRELDSMAFKELTGRLAKESWQIAKKLLKEKNELQAN